MLIAALALALATPSAATPERVRPERYREGAWRLDVRRDPFARTTRCALSRPGASVEHGRLLWRLGPRVDTSAAVWRIDGGEPRHQRLTDLPASENLANPSDGRIAAPLPLLAGAQALEARATPDARLRRLDLAGLDQATASAARLGCDPL
jgi:hypothetical protein